MDSKRYQNKVIITPNDLGEAIRSFRKEKQLTLETLSGLSNVGMRFLSELERGKETAELGKALQVLRNLGLAVIIKPRVITVEDSDLLC